MLSTARWAVDDSDFLDAAAQALRADNGEAALDALGWRDALTGLDDVEVRTAVFALFRAQGRALASSTALGALVAQPYLALLSDPPERAVAGIVRGSRRRGPRVVAIGDLAGARVLVDHPGEGVVLFDGDELAWQPVDMAGRLVLHEARLPETPRGRVVVADTDAVTARHRSAFLGRVAIAFEILGAAESALALAVGHAKVREQFGQPIGAFQAVRHLLAWGTTDCVAVEHVAAAAVALDVDAPPRWDEIAKAIAGRNGRRACERALQVLGAIGFTDEHEHHHFHSRVLALDALLGTSAALTAGLGAWQREHPDAARAPLAMLFDP